MQRKEFNPYDNYYRWAERDEEIRERDYAAETIKEFGRPIAANDNFKIEKKKAA